MAGGRLLATWAAAVKDFPSGATSSRGRGWFTCGRSTRDEVLEDVRAKTEREYDRDTGQEIELLDLLPVSLLLSVALIACGGKDANRDAGGGGGGIGGGGIGGSANRADRPKASAGCNYRVRRIEVGGQRP
jgi:hypothetical protein